MNAKSQVQKILAHLKNIGPLTQWGAIRYYRITRLSPRISEIEEDGYRVRRSWVKKNGKRFKEYALA